MWLYEHYTHNLPAKRDYEKIKKNEGMLPYLPPPPFWIAIGKEEGGVR